MTHVFALPWFYAQDAAVTDTPKPVDAREISFSVETMVKVVVFSLGIGGAMWGTTSGMRSDVRDILTSMRAQDEKRQLQDRLVDERMATMRDTINDQKRRTELLQYEVGQFKELLMSMGVKVKPGDR